MVNNRTLTAAVAASLGVSVGATGDADAAVFSAQLTQVLVYGNQSTGGSSGNLTSSTATFTYDDVTNLLTQTGGTYNMRQTTAPTSTLFRTIITGLVIGNASPASAITFACTEGNFGGGVGASICGNYSFGGNFANESTTSWGPGIAVSRTIGGDDVALGAQQSIATLDTMAELSFAGNTLVLTNKTCTGPCTTTVSGFNNGQQWTLTTTPLGPNDDTADAESGQQVSIAVLANDTGLADPVTVTIDVAPDQGGTATVVGSPGAAAGVTINYTSTPGFSGDETFTYRVVGGSANDTAVVTVTVGDTVPTAITFTSQTGVALSTPITSATATIGGISTAVPISVSAGSEYSIDGAAFTAAAGTVQNNQDVAVRHTSAATPGTDTVTTLTVGGFSTVQGTFTSTTTLVTDTTPDAFAFVDQTGVAPTSLITSAPVPITGINIAAPISVSGGEYSINGGAFTSAAGTISNGNTVRARHTSSDAPGTAVDTVLNVGGVTDTFTSTTLQYAIDDAVTTGMNQPVEIDILQNDVGLLPTVFVGIWIDPLHGTASVSPVPASPSVIRITYTPNPGYFGPDSFEYWVESGLVVDYAVANITVTNPDTDGDGVLNTVDNCSLLPNPSQCDSDGDGYGNRCDGDFTGNGATNAQDTVVFRQQLGKPSVGPTYDRADLNCNGAVNAQDTALFRQLLGKPPGPSGLVP